MTIFYNLLINNAVASVVNFTVWFALTFFVFLETQSVFATGMISGIYLLLTAVSGFWFGSLVDHYKKKWVMFWSSVASLVVYVICFALYLILPPETFRDLTDPLFWTFMALLVLGVIIGNIRNIALPTLITVLIPEDRRDKANGLAGMVAGLSFGTVSVISGLLVGYSGMYHVLMLAVIFTLIAIAHLSTIAVPEREVIHVEGADKKIDIRGTYLLLTTIPGILALIFFTTFNNFLGGVFMSLMDAYGLSLVSVQTWGIALGVLSFSFMLGGMAVAKWGLGNKPLRSLLIANAVIWAVCMFFTIQASFALLLIGMFVFMCVSPFIEAAEHTVIQKVVPLERQGRVFGFAQSVEQMASPFTAFLMGPLAQFVFIPFMTTGAGVALIGEWFGTGPDRGIALVFTVTGAVGVLVTLLAFSSRSYKDLSKQYMQTPTAEPASA